MILGPELAFWKRSFGSVAPDVSILLPVLPDVVKGNVFFKVVSYIHSIFVQGFINFMISSLIS